MDSVPQQAQGAGLSVITSGHPSSSSTTSSSDGTGELTDDPYSPESSALPQLLGLLIALMTLSVPLAAVLTSRPEPATSGTPALGPGPLLKSANRGAAVEIPQRSGPETPGLGH